MDYLVYLTVEAYTTEDGDMYAYVGEGTTTRITTETLEMLSGYQNGGLIGVSPVKKSQISLSVGKTTYHHVRNSS